MAESRSMTAERAAPGMRARFRSLRKANDEIDRLRAMETNLRGIIRRMQELTLDPRSKR